MATQVEVATGRGSLRTEHLIRASAKHLRLLHAVDMYPGDGGLYSGPALRNALWRYVNCWRPLLAELLAQQPRVPTLVPPLDVAWVWHVHRLNPVAYAADCQRLFGRLIALPDELKGFEFSDGRDRQSAATRRFWSRRFDAEPFLARVTRSSDRPPFVSNLEYDVVAAAKRQSQFLKQVMRYAYTSPVFLRAAVKRYAQFLHLKRVRPELFVVPMYDVDFIWHTHMAMAATYSADCKQLVGFLVSHDDSVNDRTPGEKLQTSYEETVREWYYLYPGQPYQVPHSEYIPEECLHLASRLIQEPWMLRGHASVLHKLQTLFGPDFARSRGGALCLYLLNTLPATERLQGRQNALKLPHSSKSRYWRRGLFGNRDVNQLGRQAIRRYKSYCRSLTQAAHRGEPGRHALMQPAGLSDAWSFWFPLALVDTEPVVWVGGGGGNCGGGNCGGGCGGCGGCGG